MLDEKALRRETFSEGTSIKLLDGQLWTFPKPYLSMYTQIGEGGKLEAGHVFTYGADYADRLDQYIECEEPIEATMIQLELAGGLLLRNYALDNAALRRILAINMDGTSEPEMWPAIRAILFGRDLPKPSAVGSTSPSQPTA
jgi:hypothetical protein